MALKLKVIKAPAKTSDCGGAESQVQWQVDNESGWVIQHVKDTNNITDCAGNKRDERGVTTLEFWEAWKVTNGNVFVGDTNTRHRFDRFSIGEQGRGTKGKVRVVGEVKFIKDYALTRPPWEDNKVPEAGSLPTTTSTPPGWDAAGSSSHVLESKWNCCADGASSTVVTGEPMPEPTPPPTTPPPVKGALKSLGSMPAWSEIGSSNVARRAIEQTMAKLEQSGLETLRAAVKLYVDWADEQPGGPSVAEMSRLFVLNRYIFNVPESAPLGSVRLFGGWRGVTTKPGILNPLWPWKIVQGKKRLRGQFLGYSGDVYQALEEFDYFRKQFPSG